MALGIVQVLDKYGEIRQNDLALAFARVHDSDPARGYGRGMRELLPRYLQEPERWPELTRSLFRGEGSLGNGSAMRVAPLGAWFRTDLPCVVTQATLSAEVTHAHPEGTAGAVAVAVASALSARRELTLDAVS
jgi:ADP-ribosylglycohydrolase